MHNTYPDRQSELAQSTQSQNGFTLIELVVALAILAIILAAAIPMFSNITGSNRAHAAAERLMQDIQWAQGEAVRSNAAYTLTLNGADCGNSYWSIHQGATLVRCMADTDFASIYKNIVVTPSATTPVSPATITISSLGMFTPVLMVDFAAPGIIAWNVSVTTSGRSEICNPAVTTC